MSENNTIDTNQLWDNVLAEVETTVSKANFTTWFKNTSIAREEGGTIFLSVPNGFVKEWLHGKYHKFILKALRDLSGGIRGLEYVVVTRGEKEKEEIVDEFQGKTIVVRYEKDLDVVRIFERMPDGTLERINPFGNFWFSWVAAHPDTELYK